MSLESLLTPRSIAIVGYSRNPSRWSYGLGPNLENAGFSGSIYCVNPKLGPETLVHGIPVQSMQSIQEPVDLAVVAVGRAHMEEALADCIENGAKTAIIPGAGYAETGDRGATLQARALNRASAAGVRILGPNCFGAFSATGRMNVLPYGDCPSGPVGFISQSGNVALTVQRELERLGLGFSLLVGLGNQADITAGELVEYCADDTSTSMVGMYLEGVAPNDGPRLLEAVRRCRARCKPVVILKGGRGPDGSEAARSHTAAMVGDDLVWETAVKDAGGILVDTVEEMSDIFHTAGLELDVPRRIYIVSDGGGDAVLAVDAAARSDISMTSLSPAQSEAISRVVPPDAPRVPGLNPLVLDTTGGVNDDPTILADIVRILSREGGEADLAILAGLYGRYQDDRGGWDLVRSLVELWQSGARFAVTTPYAHDGLRPIVTLREQGIPVLPNADRLSRALSRLGYTVPRSSPSAPHVVLDTRDSDTDRELLSPFEVIDALASQGVEVDMYRVESEAEALAKFDELGGRPGVLKVARLDVVHKTDAGGVYLNLRDDVEVQRAYRGLVGAFGDAPLLFMPMLEPGTELLVSLGSDPAFGPFITIGQGGLAAEYQSDFVLVTAPICSQSIKTSLKRLRIYPMLTGGRGQVTMDLEPLVDLAEKLGTLGSQVPGLEVEMNPVFLYEDGLAIADVRGSRSTGVSSQLSRAQRPCPKRMENARDV